MEKQAFQPVCILESSRSFDWSLATEEIIPEAFELTGPWLILHFAISNNAHMVGNSKSWLIVPRYNMYLSSKINSARFWQIPPPPLWPGQPAISSTSWRLTMADFWTDSFRSGKGGGETDFSKNFCHSVFYLIPKLDSFCFGVCLLLHCLTAIGRDKYLKFIFLC